MDENKNDCSTFSVPELSRNNSLMSTPVPQASSTVRRNNALEAETRMSVMENFCKNIKDIQQELNTEIANNMKQTKSRDSGASNVLGAGKSDLMSSLYDLQKDNVTAQTYRDNSAQQSYMSKSVNYMPVKMDIPNNTKKTTLNTESDDFKFVVPEVPLKHCKTKYSDLDEKPQRDQSVIRSLNVVSKKTVETSFGTHHDSEKKSGTDTLANSHQIFGTFPTIGKKTERVFDIDRTSVISSADSSLGILSLDGLEDLEQQSEAINVNISSLDESDLNERFAKELSICNPKLHLVDDYKLNRGQVAITNMKESNATSRFIQEEDKENKTRDNRKSNNMFLLSSYPADSSNKSNSTCEQNDKLHISHNKTGGLEIPDYLSSSISQKKPLSERNSILSRQFSNLSSKSLLGEDNPFGSCSQLSVASDEFQSAEEAANRLREDEKVWREDQLGRDSIRSLSGIYDDGDISIRTKDEKLSISSFLRSKSGPLGCLDDKVAENNERPAFGRPVVSPDRRSKIRPLAEPPQESKTMVKEKNPWNPESLVEQFSVIHDDVDVSAPSLSCIGDLLNNMSEGLSPQDMLNTLMAASSDKIKKANIKTKESSVVALDGNAKRQIGEEEKLSRIPFEARGGNNSFGQGYESDRSTRYSSSFNSDLSLDYVAPRQIQSNKTSSSVSIVTVDDSVAPSICNVTDFEGVDSEEYICVLTIQSMDFDILNNYGRPQHYSVAKSCYLNGQRMDQAALIHIPDDNFILQANEKRIMSVIVAALVEGTIKIKLDVSRRDTMTQEEETNNVYGKITAEFPKIALLSPSSVDMKPIYSSSDINGEFQEIIEIKNNGRSTIPLKLSLSNVPDQNTDMFFFNKERHRTVSIQIEPGHSYKQRVYCQTPSIFENTKSSGSVPVSARIDVNLNTSILLAKHSQHLPPLTSILLNTQLYPNFFCAPASLSIPSDGSGSFKLYNSGPTPISFQMVISSDFTVKPVGFFLSPQQSQLVVVTFTGRSYRTGRLTIHAMEPLAMHNVNLQVTSSSTSSYSSFATPQSSRVPSPTSPGTSITSLGGLQIACTHKELVWGGCALQQMVVKTCTLKNQNRYREKLLVKVGDQDGSFKMLNEKRVLEREMKISLQPMENKQISVVMLAGSLGPKCGTLIISRISNALDKKVVPLYAFGGKATVKIAQVNQDPEQHMWLYLDRDTLSSSFTLTNIGDAAAFFKVSEGLSATTIAGGLSISPPEQILLPSVSVSVAIQLSITPERLEYLLAQSSHTSVCITRLSVTHGDESTRLRLSKIDHTLARKLSTLDHLSCVHSTKDIDKLGNPRSCAESLWLEDIREWTIGVLVERSVLEALRLDTSVEFVDLANTVYHV